MYIADVHLYDHQNDKVPCRLCKKKKENIDYNDGESDYLEEDNSTDSDLNSENLSGPSYYEFITQTCTIKKGSAVNKDIDGNMAKNSVVCCHCQKGPFKNKKTLYQHVRNSCKEVQNLPGDPNMETCTHCFKSVKNLKRHIIENCTNLNGEKCPYCKSMFSSARLKYHLTTRIDKITGEIILDGCKNTKQIHGNCGKVTCKLCGKIMNKDWLKYHLHNVHRSITVTRKTNNERGYMQKELSKYEIKKTQPSRECEIMDTPIIKMKKCPTCMGNVQDMQSHLNEKCSNNFLLKCPHCNLMIVSSQWNKHMCSERKEITSFSYKVSCDLCEQKIEKKWLKYHKIVKHRPKTSKIFVSRLQMSVACTEAQFQVDQAQVQSLKEHMTNLTQEQMISSGIEFGLGLGIQLMTNNTHMPMDGNCLWSCLAYVNQPNLHGPDLHKAARRLRMDAVGWAIGSMASLDREGLVDMQAVAADTSEKDPIDRDEITSVLAQYLVDGTYQGPMGDILPQVASSFTQIPILIIEVTNGTVAGYFLNPMNIFKRDVVCDDPYVVVCQGEHYEPLLVPEESKQSLKNAYNNYLKNTAAAILPPSSASDMTKCQRPEED